MPPPSAEDFESLDNNIPEQVFQVTLFKSVINVHLADHPVFDPAMLCAPRKHRVRVCCNGFQEFIVAAELILSARWPTVKVAIEAPPKF